MNLFGIEFENPVFLASGTFGYGYEFPDVTRRMGALFTKGITPEPRAGNEPPRIYETACGLINRIGLENVGISAFLKDVLPRIKGLTRVFVNIAGSSIDDYCVIVEQLDKLVDGIELNVSCPNVSDGLIFGQDPRLLHELVTAVRKKTGLPIIVKLTPNFCDIALTSREAIESGADGISLINTLNAGFFFNGDFLTGGLSGPAIKPFALYCIDRVRKVVDKPVIGIGGITSGQDVLEFINAGADAVAIGSISLKDPEAGIRIINEYNSLIGA